MWHVKHTMGRLRAELSEKHWQALRLLEEGMSRNDVAVKIGWSQDHFKKICQGDISSAGYTADLFKKELQKISVKQEEETRNLVKDNIRIAQLLVKDTLADIIVKKKKTDVDKKLIVSLTNALNKSTPSVSIGTLSYSYTQGLKPEELIHEFTRLKTIAEGSFDRRGVQTPGSTGSGDVPAVNE